MFFFDLLIDLSRKGDEYAALEGAKYVHPEYAKAEQRANRVLDMISDEIVSRRQIII